MTEEERVKRAEAARQVTDAEIYKETWTALNERLLRAWEATKPTDTEARESMWHARRALKSVQDAFETLMAEGRQAQIAIAKRKI